MEGKRANFYTFTALFMVIIIDALGVGLIYPLLAPLFTMKVGGLLSANTTPFVRNLLYGVTLGIFPLCMFFSSPLLGDISDSLGRKKVLLVCLYGEGIGMLVAAFAVTIHSVMLLIIARAVTGLLAGSQSIAQASIVDISKPSQKAVNLSIITLAISFGFILGPLLSGIFADKGLVSWFHYNTPFFAATILAFLNGTMLVFTFKETFRSRKRDRLRLMKGVEVFISAIRNPEIKMLAIVYMCIQGAWALYVQFSALHLVQHYHYSITKVSHFYMWLSSMVAFSSLVLIRIVVQFWRTQTFVLFALLFAVVGPVICLVPQITAEWLSVLFIAVGAILAANGMLTLFSDAVDQDSQGWVMGVAAAASSLSWGIGGLLSGVLATWPYYVPFSMIALLLVLAIVFFLPRIKRRG